MTSDSGNRPLHIANAFVNNSLRINFNSSFVFLQFVPEGLKDEKYWARRRKNNMAAKRSRDARRMKENQIALRAGYLEKEVNVVFLILHSQFTYMFKV